MYLHPVLIRDLSAEQRAEDIRRAARRRRAEDAGDHRQLLGRRSARGRAGPLLGVRLSRSL